MARKRVNGIKLHVEEQGHGTPVIFVHELGGDHRSWRGQIDQLSPHYRCISYCARGYTPSDVPEDDAYYGWQIAVDDLNGVFDACQLDKAFLVGLSMGAYTALMQTMQRPERVLGLVFASGGTGANLATRDRFIADAQIMADNIFETGSLDMPGFLEGPSRVQLQNKNRQAWQEFADHFKAHSVLGTAMTLRHVQAGRPSLYDFEDKLAGSKVPMLLLAGDEDEHVLDVTLWLKRIMPYAGLSVFPKSGHLINLEEPAMFNTHLRDFLASVERGDWMRRDPRSQAAPKV